MKASSNGASAPARKVVERRNLGRGSRLRFRVAMIDVDVVQIHFAAYFQWMDRGLQEILSQPEAKTTAQMLAEGFGTPMASCHCDYMKPARLGDIIEVDSHIVRCGRTSFDVEHTFFNEQQECLAIGIATQVYVKLSTQRPAPLPAWLRALQVDASPVPDAMDAPEHPKGVGGNE